MSKGQRSTSLGTKMQTIFVAYFHHKLIDLHQTKTEMIIGTFYTVFQKRKPPNVWQ